MQEIIGGLAAFFTTVCNIPLLVKIARTKQVDALSVMSIFIGVMINVLWLIYSILYLQDITILLTNIICLVEVIILTVFYFKYRTKHGKKALNLNIEQDMII